MKRESQGERNRKGTKMKEVGKEEAIDKKRHGKRQEESGEARKGAA